MALGVFGGDAVDNVGASDIVVNSPAAPTSSTVDGNRLTLDPVTEMVSLGGGSTGALTITQGSASQDANVNINFASRYLALDSVNYSNGLNHRVDREVVGDVTFNAIRLGIVRGPTNVIGGVTGSRTTPVAPC